MKAAFSGRSFSPLEELLIYVISDKYCGIPSTLPVLQKEPDCFEYLIKFT